MKLEFGTLKKGQSTSTYSETNIVDGVFVVTGEQSVVAARARACVCMCVCVNMALIRQRHSVPRLQHQRHCQRFAGEA